jgi:hypothetical protein
MKSVKAFVVCLVLALAAGSARAKRCKISPSSCVYYSEALSMQLTLTQACMDATEIQNSYAYNPANQPWFNSGKTTVKSFIKEVNAECNFGWPNQGGVNSSPLACYNVGKPGTSNEKKCLSATKRGKTKVVTCCNVSLMAYLSAIN